MQIQILKNAVELGSAAAEQAAMLLRQALNKQGFANIILATGASQFEMLQQLVAQEAIDWSKVQLFHLDEYIGLPESHPASFRKYLKDRFVTKIPLLKAAHFINGEAADVKSECKRLSELIRSCPIDVAMVGIGENGHLAFNDPPADFETDDPFIVVELDEACRRQQLGEGWFPDLRSVPPTAISMSIRQILLSKSIVCCVPDSRKAKAVAASLNGPVTAHVPASVLQEHPEVYMFLEEASAAEL